MRKRRYCWMLIASVLVVTNALTGCGSTDIPLNGQVKFHNIEVTIEETFVRDSTRSTEDLWVFEYKNFKEYILLSRRDLDGDANKGLEDYIEYMKEEGVECELINFEWGNAVFSTYTNAEKEYCQEIVFAHKGSYYAIALRKGTEKRFQTLTNSVVLIHG